MIEDPQQRYQIENNNKLNNDHSLAPDIFTGWHHKLLPKLKQFPLIFANDNNDHISKNLTSFGSQLPYKVVYMGFRPVSNMKIFKQYSQTYNQPNVNESFLYNKKIFKKFKFNHFNQPEKFFPIRPNEYRLFMGINPTAKNQDIKFSSQFQGGNLDLAINVGPSQYDLLMRVDSNTKGHTNWFFFKVYNIKKKKNVKFNIINFCKHNQLYVEGMKPYVFRTSKMKWSQQGQNVQFRAKSVRYFPQNDQPIISKSLSFTIQLNNLQEQVYFAYSIPYSYSYLLEVLLQLQKKHAQFIRINYNQQSTGGLMLPVVTITNFTIQKQKKHCLVIGRLHPGQTQGSWMLDGFMKYLCSPQANFLREKIQFKIIPMVNVDGVVIGNFRAGISGRDLNRMFNLNSKIDFNEIKLIKNQAKIFKPEIFLDFHGHSAKRNVFIYGPEYKIQHKQYLLSRIFPKIISKKTQAFRYYSCLFRINESKKNTGRAILFSEYHTKFVFTIQASTHGYGYKKQNVNFSAQKYFQIGQKIAESLQDFIKILLKKSKKHQNQQEQRQKNKKKQKKLSNIMPEQNLLKSLQHSLSLFQTEEQIEKTLLNQIIENQKQLVLKEKKFQKHEQSQSDCQDDKNDYTQKELLQFQKNPSINHRAQTKNKQNKNDKSKIKKKQQKKSLFNKLEKIQLSKNIKTLDYSQISLGNKKLALSSQQVHQTYAYQRFMSPSISQTLNEQNILKRQIKVNFNINFKSKINQNKDHDLQKIFRLVQLKNYELNKINQTQNLKFERNKSVNQVNLEVSSDKPQKNNQEKKLPKIKSQMYKKQPMLLIRKSIIPTSMVKSNSRVLNILDKCQDLNKRQRSLIDQILQSNKRKKKRQEIGQNKNKIKILYFQQ